MTIQNGSTIVFPKQSMEHHTQLHLFDEFFISFILEVAARNSNQYITGMQFSDVNINNSSWCMVAIIMQLLNL